MEQKNHEDLFAALVYFTQGPFSIGNPWRLTTLAEPLCVGACVGAVIVL